MHDMQQAYMNSNGNRFSVSLSLPAQFFAKKLIIACERFGPYSGVDFCHHAVLVHHVSIWQRNPLENDLFLVIDVQVDLI